MMAVEDTADDWGESTPFLDPEIDEDVPEVFRRAWYQPSTPAGVVGLMTFIIFCMTLSGTICLIPLARLIEDVVCRKHYGSPDPVDEKLCKVDEIQTQLAWLGGLYIVINAVIGNYTSRHHVASIEIDRPCRIDRLIPMGYPLRQVNQSHFRSLSGSQF